MQLAPSQLSGPKPWAKNAQPCLICDELTLDTAFNRPLNRGGFNDSLNGFYCCQRCNQAKGQLTLAEYIGQIQGDAHSRIVHYLRYHTQNCIEPYHLVSQDDHGQSTTRRSGFKWKHKMRSAKHCAYCNVKARRLTVDHKQPLCRGGRDIRQNCVAACKACNQEKGSSTLAQWCAQLMDANPYDVRVAVLKTMVGKEELLRYLEENQTCSQPIDVWPALEQDPQYTLTGLKNSLNCASVRALSQNNTDSAKSVLCVGPSVRHKGPRLCMLCGTATKNTTYNRWPAHGGSVHSINGFLCCDSCNAKKGSMTLVECLYYLQPMAKHDDVVAYLHSRSHKSIEPEDLFHEFYRGVRFSAKRQVSGWKTKMRQHTVCSYCHCPRQGKLTIDHVQPLCKGGRDQRTNCVAACARCNSEKAEQTLTQWHDALVKEKPTDPRLQHIQALLAGPFKPKHQDSYPNQQFNVWPNLEDDNWHCLPEVSFVEPTNIQSIVCDDTETQPVVDNKLCVLA